MTNNNNNESQLHVDNSGIERKRQKAEYRSTFSLDLLAAAGI